MRQVFIQVFKQTLSLPRLGNWLARLVLVLIVQGTFPSCVVTGDLPLYNPLGGRSFWARNFRSVDTEFYQVQTVFRGASDRAELFVELDLLRFMTDSRAAKILSEFDRKIWPSLIDVFGQPKDIDDNDRIVIVVLDIQDNQTPSNCNSPHVAGYFDSVNQFADESLGNSLRSNEREIVYMDAPSAELLNGCGSNPSEFYSSFFGGNAFLGTLAHEFQHLIHFSQDFRNSQLSNAVPEQSWVNEGLSEVATVIAGYEEAELARLGTFRFDWPMPIGNAWQNSLFDYSAVYLFFRWLSDVYGYEILSEIILNPKSGITPVGEAIQQREEDLGYTNLDFGFDLDERAVFNLAYQNWILASLNRGEDFFTYKISYDGADGVCSSECTGYSDDRLLYEDPDHTPEVDLDSFSPADPGGTGSYGSALSPYEPAVISNQFNADPPEFDPTCTNTDSASEHCVFTYTSNDPAYLIYYHNFRDGRQVNVDNGKPGARTDTSHGPGGDIDDKAAATVFSNVPQPPVAPGWPKKTGLYKGPAPDYGAFNPESYAGHGACAVPHLNYTE